MDTIQRYLTSAYLVAFHFRVSPLKPKCPSNLGCLLWEVCGCYRWWSFSSKLSQYLINSQKLGISQVEKHLMYIPILQVMSTCFHKIIFCYNDYDYYDSTITLQDEMSIQNFQFQSYQMRIKYFKLTRCSP